MRAPELAWRVLRHDPRSRTSAVLTAVGVALGTALMALLLTLPFADSARNGRTAWQQPELADDRTAASALVRVSEDRVDDRPLTRLDVAAAGSGPVRVAGGVPAAPGAGEVLLSPALARLAADRPAGELADRFPGSVVGELPSSALGWPDQLVAVVGSTPDALGPDADQVTGLQRPEPLGDRNLALLAGVGVVVLTVPAVVLVASASRLTAARRERRLAALRLAGATPRQVVGMVSAETAVAAAGGALAGLLASWPIGRLAAQVPWGDGDWFAADLAPRAPVVALLALLVPALVVAATVLGLTRVLREPLVAATGGPGRRVSPWRLGSLVVVALLLVQGITTFDEGGGLVLLLVALAAVMLSASVVGPWVTGALGTVFVRLWRRPAVLLAGRRLTDDPKAAYRAASGLVLAVFVGTMALVLLDGTRDLADEQTSGSRWRADVLPVSTAEPLDRADRDLVAGELLRLGAATDVVLIGPGSDEATLRQVLVAPVAPDDPVLVLTDDSAAARTALARALPGEQAQSGQDEQVEVDVLLGDLVLVTAGGLSAAAVLAGASAAVVAAGGVIDRQKGLGTLLAAGASATVLLRSLQAEAALPALVATTGAGIGGAAVGSALLTAIGGTTVLTPWLASPVVLGLVVALLAASSCGPALRRVAAEPLREV